MIKAAKYAEAAWDYLNTTAIALDAKSEATRVLARLIASMVG